MINNKLIVKLSNPWYLLATGFGSGLSPIIPGTIGSLAAIPFWLLMYYLFPDWLRWFVISCSFSIGIIICQQISNNIQFHDHSSIVWDEFVGMWVSLMALPIINWRFGLIAFLLFRFFDILKPWPISWFNKRIYGGFGIMLDDILASIFVIIINWYLYIKYL